MKKLINDTHVKAIIDQARVARLATVDSQGRPHLVPVVFTFDGKYFYIPLDDKTKQQPSSDPFYVRFIMIGVDDPGIMINNAK